MSNTVNKFAIHIKNVTLKNLQAMHFDEALDYAFNQIKMQIANKATKGAMNYSIDLDTIYTYCTDYIVDQTKYSADLPDFNDINVYLKNYLSEKLCKDDNFYNAMDISSISSNNMQGVCTICYTFGMHGQVQYLRFNWANIFN